MGFLTNFIPAELGPPKSFFGLRIGNFLASGRVPEAGKSTKFRPAAFGHETAKMRFVIGKILKRSGGGPFLTHQDQRRVRNQTEERRGGAKSCRRDQLAKPRPESMIPDLVMIRDAKDERLRWQLSRLRGLIVVAADAGFALEKPTMFKRGGKLVDRPLIWAVITFARAGQHHPDDVVKVVRPDGVEADSIFLRWEEELDLVALVLRRDKTA